MHARADAAAPAKGTMTKGARILAVFEEALRPEAVGFWEIGLVEVDCTVRRVSRQKSTSTELLGARQSWGPASELTGPQRGNNCAALGDKHAPVHVVGRARVRGPPEHGHGSPPQRLGRDSPDVLEPRHVVKGRQAVAPNHAVQLLLRARDEVRSELDAGQEEAGYRAS